MVGAIGLIFMLLPETPWWLVSKGKMDKAKKSLQTLNEDVKDHDYGEQLVTFSHYKLD